MDELDLKNFGASFRVGDDLYGISVSQLKERIEALNAELARITQAIQKKNEELTTAETFFMKP